jgi:uncharacterized protein (DUF4415 family)
MGDDFSKTARLFMPAGGGEEPVSPRLDDNMIAWFRAQRKGPLSRVKAVWRAYVLARRDPHGCAADAAQWFWI